jgi:sugar (pentulose or hexulose) kinase
VSSGVALLVDFGASRVKAALFHAGENRILLRAERPSPEPRWGDGGEVEIDPRAHAAVLDELAAELCGPRLAAPSSVWLCSEMHGFVLDDGHGTALTPYISWRDMRAMRVSPGERESAFDRCSRELGDEFFSITGMRLKPGLPFINLVHIARCGGLPPRSRFLSLPEWIAASAGTYSGSVHISMAAASGFYDLKQHDWSRRLMGMGAGNESAMDFGVPSDFDGLGLGTVKVAGRTLPLFGGFGDLQTAIFGAGVPNRSNAAINLGTGSQVVRLARSPVPAVERRPYFSDQELAAITHIPSGRALNVYAGLFDAIGEASGGSRGAFWRLFGTLAAEEILAAPLPVDLNVFPGSWRFERGGSIAGILEPGTAAPPLVASVALGWLRQYADALDMVDPGREEGQVVLAGGLVRRCQAAPAVLEALTGRHMLPPEGEEDETITGLAAAARGVMGR